MKNLALMVGLILFNDD